MIQTIDRAIFAAMGTEVELLAHPRLSSTAEERVRTWFSHVESALSRFKPDSELSRLNESAGAPFCASRLLYQVLGESIRAAERSDGLFDPTILPAVRASGYAISYDLMSAEVSTRPPLDWQSSYRDIRLLPERRVLLPRNTEIDLGGFAKGWTVDRCAALMDPDTSWIVNAGGDLLAHGAGPEGEGWFAGIEDPFQPGNDLAVLRLRDCGVATSSVMRRRWRTDRGDAHHLIDPRTEQPSATDLASVTVISNSVAQAEVDAKVLLLLGREQAVQHAERNRMPAVLVGQDGRQTCAGGIGGFLVA